MEAAASRLDPALVERLSRHITLADGAHQFLNIRAPFTGEVLFRVPCAQKADVEAAVRRARAAQPAWAALSFRQRARIFIRFHDLLLKRQAEELDLIQLESGKARRNAYEEILDTAIVARYYAIHARDYLKPRRRRGALPLLTRTWQFHTPIGVAGFIAPWNYPLSLVLTDALPALMAGNAAVLKPDRQTTLTALWAVDLLRQAGLPDGVLPVVTGEGAVAGPLLTELVDFLMFTGSTATGRTVAEGAAARLIGCSLELGGKNPMIVLADANLDAAAESAARGAFVGAGQVCVSIERLYVQRSVYEAFLSRLIKITKEFKLGSALDFSCDVGSLTSQRQLSTVENHVRDAVEKGATIQTGGQRRPELGPLFYEPTILTGVRPGMLAYAEETFGPVLAVYPFDTETEAVERANDTCYGLNASIWTRDTARGVALGRKIRAGSVNVNEAYAAAWGSVDSPIGGMRQSGLGRRHGAEGILKYTETQTVAVQRWLPIAPLPILGVARSSHWMTRLIRFVRHLPGLR